MAEQAGKPKRPNLRAAPWSDEQLAQEALVIPRDIDAAKVWWRSYAPPGFKNLLDAEPLEPDA